MEIPENGSVQRFSQWLKQSLFIKLMSIGFLILVLLAPKSMIESLIYERQFRQQETAAEVSQSWGPSQTIIGPVLTVPYTEMARRTKGDSVYTKKTAVFLPSLLDVKGNVNPEIRRRGIFDVVLYQTDLLLTGKFPKPDFAPLQLENAEIHWDQAKLSVGLTGMTGIKSLIELNWEQKPFRMEPGSAFPDLIPTGVSVGIPLKQDSGAYNFSIPLKLNGSEYLRFEPIGKETTVTLKSTWPSPSFEGVRLPDEKQISDTGFSATWKVFDLNRNYPQQWTGQQFSFEGGGFGVKLYLSVDDYQKNTRAAKYAILIIGLTFMIYFFFETLRKLQIHPFQYLLVGLALCVFYLLLLSVSEHLGFNKAYLAATVATVGLIALYSASVLKVFRLTIQLTLLLVTIFGFVFVVLQQEDYALLLGSVGIFIALAVVMLYSRKVDWYNPQRKE